MNSTRSLRVPLRKIKRLLITIFIVFIVFIVYANYFFKSPVIEIPKAPITPAIVNETRLTTQFNFNKYFEKSKTQLSYSVHIFYYAWYGNPETDKKWIHWNHKRLPHWNEGLIKDFPLNGHNPPDDIGANFYPALGLYSSNDANILDQHLKMITFTGIGVIILSWYGEHRSDPNGHPNNDIVKIILDKADTYNVKVALHIEPYGSRSALSVKKDLIYIRKNYANHSAYYRKPRFKSKNPLPVVFIYDSYLISPNEWMQVFGKKRSHTIRGTMNDFFVVGLLLERDSCNELATAEFDAGYTYFATEQVSYSSASSHWIDINRKCSLRNIEFYPSIGPGYKDSAVRPWNDFSTQERSEGQFYYKRFSKMLKSGARSFGVTSFNEWHEGTQIEPAIPRSHPTDRLLYESYLPQKPEFYLDLTRQLVESFVSNTDQHLAKSGDI